MNTYDLLSAQEKRGIILNRIRSLEYVMFSTEVELIEESSSVPDASKVSELTGKVQAMSEKIAALKLELDKYPEQPVS